MMAGVVSRGTEQLLHLAWLLPQNPQEQCPETLPLLFLTRLWWTLCGINISYPIDYLILFVAIVSPLSKYSSFRNFRDLLYCPTSQVAFLKVMLWRWEVMPSCFAITDLPSLGEETEELIHFCFLAHGEPESEQMLPITFQELNMGDRMASPRRRHCFAFFALGIHVIASTWAFSDAFFSISWSSFVNSSQWAQRHKPIKLKFVQCQA